MLQISNWWTNTQLFVIPQHCRWILLYHWPAREALNILVRLVNQVRSPTLWSLCVSVLLPPSAIHRCWSLINTSHDKLSQLLFPQKQASDSNSQRWCKNKCNNICNQISCRTRCHQKRCFTGNKWGTESPWLKVGIHLFKISQQWTGMV